MRRAAPLILGCAALALSGCPERATYALVDGFEERCEGDVPCRWTVQAGSRGTATWQGTLPGEHGLRLEGGPMALVRETPDVELAAGVDSSRLVADLSVRCDADEELLIEVTVESLASGTPLLLAGTLTPPDRWDGTLDAVSLREASGLDTVFRDVLALRIVKGGAATCELDYVALRIASGFE